LVEHHCTGVVDDAGDVDHLGLTVVGARERPEAASDVLNSMHPLVAIGEHVSRIVDHFL